MVLTTFLLAIRFTGACLVVHIFCSAAREFVSASEMGFLPLSYTTYSRGLN